MAEQTGPFVVLTRATEDNRQLADILRRRGVPVLEVPCIAIRYITPAARPDRSEVVAFTSRRGVRGLLRHELWKDWLLRGIDASSQKEARMLVAAVGRATADELEASGIRADLIAEPPEGRVLAESIAGVVKPGGRIAVVRGNLRAGGMDEALRKAGYLLNPVEVYENHPPEIPSLDPAPVAAVFVASPSAGRRILERNLWLRGCRFLSIGRTTEQALRALGVASIVPAGPSLNDWVDALCRAHAQALGLEG